MSTPSAGQHAPTTSGRAPSNTYPSANTSPVIRNANKKWTDSEEEDLIDRREKGATYATLATHFGVSINAVRKRYRKVKDEQNAQSQEPSADAHNYGDDSGALNGVTDGLAVQQPSDQAIDSDTTMEDPDDALDAADSDAANPSDCDAAKPSDCDVVNASNSDAVKPSDGGAVGVSGRSAMQNKETAEQSSAVAGSENNQEQLKLQPATVVGTCPSNATRQASRKRRRMNSPSPSPVAVQNHIGNLALRVEQMQSDVINAARQIAELERCNASLTEANADMEAHAPEGWIPPAELLKQLKQQADQQADQHAAQVGALETEHASRIKSLEAQVEELEVRLGKYKTAINDLANIT